MRAHLLVTVAVLAAAPAAHASPVSLAGGAVVAFDGKTDAAEIEQAIAAALGTGKELVIFSGDVGDACAPRASLDEDRANLDDLLDTYREVVGDDYPRDVSIFVNATPAGMRSVAPEVKELLRGGQAIAIFAFCASSTWLGKDPGAQGGKGLFF